ncbi:sigma-70 family RNA polymerase sigma factor [Actinoplanes sp. LDG1-06]|uniref:Sigma-70 family RNA polymerase sigma factor n=1 Tax=Paractinoplanes ovalisporus TaxID=2810368 RepID=A0ABS2AUT7_9ACTN|nr:sigma-70 family RNA polymerase sigma factor [Actinoplanes ovalisporus]MBM2623500.1 sigma-70 family RNA polymerase sigma factor [Actinoplanes ovalisporus]
MTDLLSRIRQGDSAAWTALTGQYTNLLWAVARSQRMNESDAADAVQTAWLRLIENIDDIREPDRLGSWLATIVRRECHDIRRRAARLRPGGTEELDAPGEADDPLDSALLRDERDAALWRAFAGLRPPCRRLLRVLMADPPPSYTEVAAALDIAVGSIGPTRQRCLKCLRDLLRASDGQIFSERDHAARGPAGDHRDHAARRPAEDHRDHAARGPADGRKG